MNAREFYKIIGPKPFQFGDYMIESIQLSDAEMIRRWRNEQISALRQSSPLSAEDQSIYFNKINKDFPLSQPEQILVRFCLNRELIGYGGLVHIDWINLQSEISFLLETSRVNNQSNYAKELSIFFGLIKEIAFDKICLNKISAEAYAHRSFHVLAIENAGFQREGILRQQTKVNGEWVDSVVSSCLRSEYLEDISE